jgi:uncharacterized protein YodC (DUF2158 family)
MPDVHEFTPGTVVRLKSGGPRMTVLRLRDHGECDASWFINDTIRIVRGIPLAALRVVPAGEAA